VPSAIFLDNFVQICLRELLTMVKTEIQFLNGQIRKFFSGTFLPFRMALMFRWHICTSIGKLQAQGLQNEPPKLQVEPQRLHRKTPRFLGEGSQCLWVSSCSTERMLSFRVSLHDYSISFHDSRVSLHDSSMSLHGFRVSFCTSNVSLPSCMASFTLLLQGEPLGL
jgi:hypothetical protein